MTRDIIPYGTKSPGVSVTQYNDTLTIINIHLSDSDFDNVPVQADPGSPTVKNLWSSQGDVLIAFYREHDLPAPPLKAY